MDLNKIAPNKLETTLNIPNYWTFLGDYPWSSSFFLTSYDPASRCSWVWFQDPFLFRNVDDVGIGPNNMQKQIQKYKESLNYLQALKDAQNQH